MSQSESTSSDQQEFPNGTGSKRKYVFVALFVCCFMIILILFVIIISNIFQGSEGEESEASQVADNQDEETIELDLNTFNVYKKSHFGFMHPDMLYSFVSELNVHWQRPHPGPFIWGDIEQEPGSFDWTIADEYVLESQSYDILIMATIWPYAQWDQKTCHEELPGVPRKDFPELGNYRSTPCDDDAYIRFVKALVERYDGDGNDDMKNLKYPIKHWEVINEPEMEGDLVFFTSENKADDYKEILKITYNAIKSADKETYVMNGGIAGLQDEEGLFWKNVLSGSGKNSIDILTIHSISGPQDLNLIQLQELILDYDLKQSVWVTEVQFGSMKPDPNLFYDHKDKIEPELLDTGEEWADYLVKTFVQAFARGADKLFYVGIDTLAPGEDMAQLVKCSEVNKMSEKKPDISSCKKQDAYYAFHTMVDKIDYFTMINKLDDGLYKVKLDDSMVYVLWDEHDLPNGVTGNIIVTDIYGKSESIIAKNFVPSGEVHFVEEK